MESLRYREKPTCLRLFFFLPILYLPLKITFNAHTTKNAKTAITTSPNNIVSNCVNISLTSPRCSIFPAMPRFVAFFAIAFPVIVVETVHNLPFPTLLSSLTLPFTKTCDYPICHDNVGHRNVQFTTKQYFGFNRG